jgi:metallo-beta-lactamase family protein
MRLTFFGAAGEVTGSSYLLETDRARVLIDFGMHQGEAEADQHNKLPAGLDAGRLNAVLLTHAHIDHCGRLPMLVPAGLKAPVWATPATIELTDILLRDTATLQENDATRENATRALNGQPPIKPLFGLEEVGALVKLLRLVSYDTPTEVAPGIRARYVDSGHILGAASIEVTVREGAAEKVIVFSGDIGPRGLPLINDPTLLKRADVVLLESTYGDRDHRSREETIAEFDSILEGCRGKCGKVLIPAFAVGRTQDIIYEMARLWRRGRMDDARVYVDSPMATDVTGLYRRHRELFDAEARALLANGDSPLNFPGLRFIKTSEESKTLNTANGIVVIAASGMCTGGRIVHHLKHNLAKPDTHVVIVGFQAEGTLGRRLVDGQKVVRILGDDIPVRAQIHTLGGFSAHAGQTELIQWAKSFDPKPRRLILTHGEPSARNALWDKLKAEIGVEADRPLMGDTYEL